MSILEEPRKDLAEEQRVNLAVEDVFRQIVIPRIKEIEKKIKDEQQEMQVIHTNSVSIGGPVLIFDPVTKKELVSKVYIDAGVNVVPYCNLTVYSAGNGNIWVRMSSCFEKNEHKKIYLHDELTKEEMDIWADKFYEEYKKSYKSVD